MPARCSAPNYLSGAVESIHILMEVSNYSLDPIEQAVRIATANLSHSIISGTISRPIFDYFKLTSSVAKCFRS